MRIKFLLLIIAILLVLISGCGNPSFPENRSDIESSLADSPLSAFCINTLRKTYITNSHADSFVQVDYPQIQTDQNDYKSINEEIAAMVPLFVVSTYGEDYHGLTLEMDYTVYTYMGKWISVVFEGIGNVQDTAHPTNILFSLNFDLVTGSRVALSDIFPIDSSTVQKLREAYSSDDYKAEWLQEIPDIQLLELLQNSDRLFGNTYSYFTSEGLYVSLQAPHAIGDHVEFRIPDFVI